jgi:hypothetical protein
MPWPTATCRFKFRPMHPLPPSRSVTCTLRALQKVARTESVFSLPSEPVAQSQPNSCFIESGFGYLPGTGIQHPTFFVDANSRCSCDRAQFKVLPTSLEHTATRTAIASLVVFHHEYVEYPAVSVTAGAPRPGPTQRPRRGRALCRLRSCYGAWASRMT